MQKILNEFEKYCSDPEIDSGKARSYAFAIKYLCDYLEIYTIDDNSVSQLKSVEGDIRNKESMLYNDLIKFLSARRQKSYLEKGWIRAALKHFFAFYKNTVNN